MSVELLSTYTTYNNIANMIDNVRYNEISNNLMIILRDATDELKHYQTKDTHTHREQTQYET